MEKYSGISGPTVYNHPHIGNARPAIVGDILLRVLRNLFKRSLKQNYLSSLIEIIQPKTIVTFIDNSNDFFTISKVFKGRNIKFIAIQNAHRYDVHSQNKNLYIPNYFVVGTHEVEVFKKNSENISKIKSIGSLTAAVVKNHFELVF